MPKFPKNTGFKLPGLSSRELNTPGGFRQDQGVEYVGYCDNTEFNMLPKGSSPLLEVKPEYYKTTYTNTNWPKGGMPKIQLNNKKEDVEDQEPTPKNQPTDTKSEETLVGVDGKPIQKWDPKKLHEEYMKMYGGGGNNNNTPPFDGGKILEPNNTSNVVGEGGLKTYKQAWADNDSNIQQKYNNDFNAYVADVSGQGETKQKAAKRKQATEGGYIWDEDIHTLKKKKK